MKKIAKALNYIFHSVSPLTPSGYIDCASRSSFYNISKVEDLSLSEALKVLEDESVEDFVYYGFEDCIEILSAEHCDFMEKVRAAGVGFMGAMSLNQMIEEGFIDEESPLVLVTQKGEDKTLCFGTREEFIAKIQKCQNEIDAYDSRFPVWASQRSIHPTTADFEV